MEAQVPRHLNKKPLIAGLEPIELLAVAALLIGSNILCKSFEVSPLWAGAIALSTFAFLKFFKRGRAPGFFIYYLKFHLGKRHLEGFQNVRK